FVATEAPRAVYVVDGVLAVARHDRGEHRTLGFQLYAREHATLRGHDHRVRIRACDQGSQRAGNLVAASAGPPVDFRPVAAVWNSAPAAVRPVRDPADHS